MNTRGLGGEIPQRAVSIFGQNETMDDFPVLKAFQQYVDAEQEKARKRVLSLGIFFSIVLVIVIVVFMILLYGINSRNQSLSDQLVEYAMHESDRRLMASTAAQQQQSPAQDTAALKAMTDALTAIQQKLQQPEVKPLPVDTDQERKVQADAAKLERMKRELAAEKQRLAEEKERLRQIELEQQRRKLYPELYGDVEDAASSSYRRTTKSPSRTRSRTLTDDDIREIIREAYADSRAESDAKATPEKPVKSDKRKTSEEATDEGDDDEAIEYFKDDEYEIPVDVKGTSSRVRFTVPVE